MKLSTVALLVFLPAVVPQQSNYCSALCSQNIISTPLECQVAHFNEWAACICPHPAWAKVIQICIQECEPQNRGWVTSCPGGSVPRPQIPPTLTTTSLPVSITPSSTSSPDHTFSSTTIAAPLPPQPTTTTPAPRPTEIVSPPLPQTTSTPLTPRSTAITSPPLPQTTSTPLAPASTAIASPPPPQFTPTPPTPGTTEIASQPQPQTTLTPFSSKLTTAIAIGRSTTTTGYTTTTLRPSTSQHTSLHTLSTSISTLVSDRNTFQNDQISTTASVSASSGKLSACTRGGFETFVLVIVVAGFLGLFIGV